MLFTVSYVGDSDGPAAAGGHHVATIVRGRTAAPSCGLASRGRWRHSDVHVKSFRRRLVYFICRTTNDMYCTAAERLYPSTSTARGQATCDVHCAGSPQYDEWRQG